MSNKALLNANLSGKAYKLYAYMCYRIGTAPSWEFNKKEILKHFKEGRDSVYEAEKELIKSGFLRKIQKRNSGRFNKNDYEIFAEPTDSDFGPFTENPETVKPETVKPVTANQTYSNKEVNNKELINKDSFKEKKEIKSLEAIENEIKDHFTNKAYKSNVEEFLLYHKANIRDVFKKLAYWGAKWEAKFEDINKNRKVCQNDTVERVLSEKEEKALDFIRAKIEYCKKFKGGMNADFLTQEEIEIIKKGS